MKLYSSQNVLGSGSITVSNAPTVTIGPSGVLVYIAKVDNGSGGVTTDSPDITWGLYVSDTPDGEFTRYEASDALLAYALARIEPDGTNAVVDATATISGLPPGMQVKLVPVTATGGGGDSRLSLREVTN